MRFDPMDDESLIRMDGRLRDIIEVFLWSWKSKNAAETILKWC